MRKCIVLLAGLVCAGLSACGDGNGAAAAAKGGATENAKAGPATSGSGQGLSWRFAGLNAIKDKTNLVVFREVASLPDFEGLRAGLAERLAEVMALKAAGATNAELAKLLRPITEDLVAYQSVFEQAGSNCTLAVEIPAERHEVWKSNWEPILKLVKVPGAMLSREGKWSVVSKGSTKSVLDRAGQPASDVLELTGDGALLKKLLPNRTAQKVTLKMSVQGNSLRTEGKATFEKDLNLKLRPWEIPMNTIREPIVGFSALQGFAKERFADWGPFKKHPAPDQVFLWNEGRTPFSILAAGKVDDPAKVVEDFVKGINLAEVGKKLLGDLEFNTNSSMLLFKGLPLAVPFLGMGHEQDKGFLLAGLMPMAFSGKPMPAELARELTSRTNLVYYDWELTYARIEQWQPVAQIFGIATQGEVPMFNHPAQKWMHAAEKLGNAVTEISQSGPRELTLARGSDIGLTAAEIYALTAWIAGPEPARRKGKGPAAPGAPAPL